MRRSFTIVFSLLVALSILISACAPQATPGSDAQPAQNPTNTAAPTAAEAAEMPAEAPEEGSLPEVDPGEVTGNIITAGSSTVYPLSEAIADLFKSEGYSGDITIDSIGSGAGFERFCKTGETDVSNASRAIKESEIENCQAIGRDPIEFRVGTDALAVVINPQNDFLTGVTLEELAVIFSDKSETWADINPDWPSEPIRRYAPGTDSGTYDFFIEAVMQPQYESDAKKAMEAFQSAKNLQQSEDDNVLVQGVQGDRYAIGFFGFAYFQENEGNIKTIEIDGVTPSAESAETGTYVLARPLFIYSDATIMQEKPQVAAFVNFYLARVDEVILEVGYFPASEEAINASMQALLAAMQ